MTTGDQMIESVMLAPSNNTAPRTEAAPTVEFAEVFDRVSSEVEQPSHSVGASNNTAVEDGAVDEGSSTAANKNEEPAEQDSVVSGTGLTAVVVQPTQPVPQTLLAAVLAVTSTETSDAVLATTTSPTTVPVTAATTVSPAVATGSPSDAAMPSQAPASTADATLDAPGITADAAAIASPGTPLPAMPEPAGVPDAELSVSSQPAPANITPDAATLADSSVTAPANEADEAAAPVAAFYQAPANDTENQPGDALATSPASDTTAPVQAKPQLEPQLATAQAPTTSASSSAEAAGRLTPAPTSAVEVLHAEVWEIAKRASLVAPRSVEASVLTEHGQLALTARHSTAGVQVTLTGDAAAALDLAGLQLELTGSGIDVSVGTPKQRAEDPEQRTFTSTTQPPATAGVEPLSQRSSSSISQLDVLA